MREEHKKIIDAFRTVKFAELEDVIAFKELVHAVLNTSTPIYTGPKEWGFECPLADMILDSYENETPTTAK